MNKIQEDLLKLAQDKNLGKYTLREIASFIGETSPQKIKHHLQQLEKKNLIRIDKDKEVVEKIKPGLVSGLLKKAKLLAIPILGIATAGPAQIFAEENIEGYLRISDTMLKGNARNKLFVLRVSGPSMNRVDLDGKNIEDGDFVVINSEAKDPQNGDIVLSVIDGMANIKLFYRDKENNQIVLMSKSSHDFPPIYIHENDDYMINGKVVQVIKKPSI